MRDLDFVRVNRLKAYCEVTRFVVRLIDLFTVEAKPFA